MKNRQGFVSNSSSTSFIIYGKALSAVSLKEKMVSWFPEEETEEELQEIIDNEDYNALYERLQYDFEQHNFKLIVIGDYYEPELVFGFGNYIDQYSFNEISDDDLESWKAKCKKLFEHFKINDSPKLICGTRGE